MRFILFCCMALVALGSLAPLGLADNSSAISREELLALWLEEEARVAAQVEEQRGMLYPTAAEAQLPPVHQTVLVTLGMYLLLVAVTGGVIRFVFLEVEE